MVEWQILIEKIGKKLPILELPYNIGICTNIAHTNSLHPPTTTTTTLTIISITTTTCEKISTHQENWKGNGSLCQTTLHTGLYYKENKFILFYFTFHNYVLLSPFHMCLEVHNFNTEEMDLSSKILPYLLLIVFSCDCISVRQVADIFNI